LCSFLLFDVERSNGTPRWILAAYCWFGLAVLAKGLIGMILPAGIIGVYLILTRRLGRRRDMRLLPGLAVFLAVASTWYVPVVVKHGWAFVNEFFISHHFERFTTPKFHHPGPVYYFIPVMLGGIFPWTAFLISAFARLRWSQLHTDDSRSRLQWFCAVWILGPLLFFSFSSSKLPGYILPVLPAAAFLVAGELERLFATGADRVLKWALYITTPLVLVIGVAGVIYARREIQPDEIGNILILLVIGVTAAGLLAFSRVKKIRAAIAALIVGCAVSFTLVSHYYLPAIADTESLRRLALVALNEMQPGEKVVGYYYFHHALTFYTNARSFYDEKGNVILASSPNELIDRARREGSLLCVTRQEVLKDLMKDARLRVQRLGQQRDIVLVRVVYEE